jgi:flagellar basal-body rod protein FlgB
MSEADVAPAVASSTATPGADGNNVDLGTETLNAMQSTFRYQLISRAVGDRAALVTTAIGGW